MGWNMSNILVNEAIAIKKAGSGGGSDPGLADRVSALETTVGDSSSGLVKDVDDLETTVGDSSSGLVKDVDDLETTVGDSSAGLVKSVSDLETTVGDSSSGLVKEVSNLAESIVTTLSGLSDTAITTPSDGQVLAYDGTTEKWVNASGGSGGGEVYPAPGTEVKIGTWGSSDLYRQCFESNTSGGTVQIDITSSGIALNKIRRISGGVYYLINASAGAYYPLCYSTGSGSSVSPSTYKIYKSGASIYLEVTMTISGMANPHYYFVVDYLK